MSQSTVACYIVRFTALPNDDAARAALRHALQHAGFATTVADADGIPHRLATDCYALTSVQEKSDVERLAQALGQQALGLMPQAEALLCDEYFTALRQARATTRGHCHNA
ncbi:type V toxin-antitoxin system endoribonuclease antitoxin GhoS [Edwardsiella piscicida]|uniref:type V toxin-antitoxin system endoribonuclease antitoxin GhoS n=1 Tax=Edwardsiella piscicida TaxID=1263550 RepID=UPI00370D4BEF